MSQDVSALHTLGLRYPLLTTNQAGISFTTTSLNVLVFTGTTSQLPHWGETD